MKEPPGDGIEDAARELYGLAPSAFVAARDVLAAEARRRGDRDLARAVKALRRPTASAWLANLLVRERRAEVDQLLALGAALRDAQRQLDAGSLRDLARRRHQVVSALAAQAAALGEERDAAVSEAVRRELVTTLEAALTDPDAGAALLAGRLATALVRDDFGLAGEGGPPPPRSEARPARVAEERDADGETARRQAEAALRDRQAELAEAEERAGATRRRSEELEAAHRDAARRRRELEEHLERARAEEAAVATSLEEARAEAAARVDAVKAARHAEEQARRDTGPPSGR